MADKYSVITISREYAAGGRTVAKKLSEILNIPWYDHDLAKAIAKESGYSEEEVISEGEELSTSDKFLDFVLNNVNSYVSSHDAIFKTQREKILEFAKTPCIIVGRCANRILKENGVESFDVFLYAPKDIRIKRAEELVNYRGEKLVHYLEKRDTFRENYYRAYTKGVMNRAQDYEICLDTGAINYDNCAKIIAMAVNADSKL